MNKEFTDWLQEQKYTFTDSGIFTYMWREVMYLANENHKFKEVHRRKYLWGLWRKINE